MELKERKGPCLRCKKEITIFIGKKYCDECIAILEREQKRKELLERATDRIRDAKNADMLRLGTTRCTFAKSDKTIEQMNPQAWQRAHEWKGEDNVFAYGDVGVGKSYLCRCLLMRAALYGSIGELSARRLFKVSARFDEGRGLYQRACRIGTLLLDDIDKVQLTEDGMAALWELFDERNGGNKVTLITTNVTPSDLKARWLERVANKSLVDATLNRLQPNLLVLHMTGTTLRRRAENKEGA